MSETIKDRAVKLLRELDMSQPAFQEACGLGGGFISRISLMTRKANFDKIKKAFPQVNINWLLTGNGEMFCDEPSEIRETINERLIRFAESNGMNARQFERHVGLANGYLNKPSESITKKVRLLLHDKFPTLNLNWLLTGEGEMTSESSETFSSAHDRLKLLVKRLGIGESFFLAHCGLSAKSINTLPKVLPEDIINSIAKAYPNLNISWVLREDGEMLDNNIISIRFSGRGTNGDTIICKEVSLGFSLANPATYLFVGEGISAIGKVTEYDSELIIIDTIGGQQAEMRVETIKRIFTAEFLVSKG